jgi:hypothetical protein
MPRGRTRRWIAAPIAALVAALGWSATGLAVNNVPSIKNVHANPNTFCAKKSDACSHPGTTIRFTLSAAAKVRGDIRPRSSNVGPLVEFVRRFPKGTNTARINDRHLTTGTWVVRLQGRNSVGSGPVAQVHVHVVKSG